MISLFIVFEGPDWVGKSTLLESVGEALRASPSFNKRVLTTKEPGGSEFGLKLRKILFDKNEKISPLTETLIFLADRAEHTKTLIEKENDDNTIILSDRYDLSTAVYQCMEKGVLDYKDLFKIEEMLGFPTPDMGVIMIANEPFISNEADTFMEKYNYDWDGLNRKFITLTKNHNLKMLDYPKVIINSSLHSIEESTDKILKEIKTLKVDGFVL
jgi:dTMP kinase